MKLLSKNNTSHFFFTLIVAVITLNIFVIITLTSCSCQEGTAQLNVDSINNLPASIRLIDTLHIKFWGYVGYSGCDNFDNFQTNITGNHIDISVWERYYICTRCALQTVDLNGQDCPIIGLAIGRDTIVIHSKNGSTITKIINVY